MARQVDERFEGTGYEEPWTETIQGTGVIDEDQLTSGVTGAPADWDVQCCKFVHVAAEGTRTVRNLGSNLTIANSRVEVIIEAESLTNGESCAIAYGKNTADSAFRWQLFLRQASGLLLFRTNLLYDGTDHFFDTGTISLNTRYRHEIRWDTSALAATWLMDGTQVTTQSIDVSTRTIGLIRLGAVSSDAKACTYYIDNVVVDDAAWPIGAESAGGRVFDEKFEGAGYEETWVEGP